MADFEIRQLRHEEFDQAQLIFCQAYPAIKKQSFEHLTECVVKNRGFHNADIMRFYGVWQNNTLCAAFIMFEFEMNFRKKIVPVGGIAAVAVGLVHKKRHIARTLIKFFIDETRRKGFLFSALYPFRPDFYKKMGYSYGYKAYEYRFSPNRLINDGMSGELQIIDKSADATIKLLDNCYKKHLAVTHGALSKSERCWKKIIDDEACWIIGEFEKNVLRSYMACKIARLEDGNGDGMDLCVDEIIGADSRSWKKYRSFLSVQSDQFSTINMQTSMADFHYNFTDPRFHDSTAGSNGKFICSRQNLGMMLRISEPAECWRQLSDVRFGDTDAVIGFEIDDSLFERKNTFQVKFTKGFPKLTGEAPLFTVKMQIAEYTALLMNSADVVALHDYGLIETDCSDSRAILKRIFNACDLPSNTVYF